ncbi:transcriptional regulator, LysR family [Lampropedia hyalina DSM 16112]|jgi:DNA-binding transcriptional LysR family regulator|uniref:Transcriptional regulator, LysR family n=1 Tax=Lampropedia hyalina DSM 16112 TaxID=1122156 RepID=A0A1M4YSP7_9BURK|nr:LysR substrate-binding domain-containing protein [Lampropedia hyalina]SHF08738.1 transcriptional regulator, LysR family [Lampropedia hyalina DSM 16112]
MQIPHLAAFRFFEAAAQTGSFVKAAEQLHVTHGAVSRQIRQLEEALGVELFDRRNRAVFLNAAGRTLHAVTSSMFEQLEDVVRRLESRRDDMLVVSCEPTLAMKWLIPRLSAFHQTQPDINLHLMAAGGPIDFARTGVDLALRRNDFQWSSEVYAEKICDEWMGPVSRARHTPKGGLKNTTLLHSSSRPKAWATWSRNAGMSIDRSARVDYEHFYLCMQAAMSGLGIALASFLMVQDELKNGQLHAPYGFIHDGSSYFLLSPEPFGKPEDKRERFRQWLVTEVSSCLGPHHDA